MPAKKRDNTMLLNQNTRLQIKLKSNITPDTQQPVTTAQPVTTVEPVTTGQPVTTAQPPEQLIDTTSSKALVMSSHAHTPSDSIPSAPSVCDNITITKRTQKAKSKATDQTGSRLVLPDSLDDIISGMQFQEPAHAITASVVLEKQAQVIQKQQELLEQLQQGIRPGWFIQCIAKRADGKQCTRNIKKGTDFCMGHANKCIYGKITDGITNASAVTRSADVSASGSIINTTTISKRQYKKKQPSTASNTASSNKVANRKLIQSSKKDHADFGNSDEGSSESEDEEECISDEHEAIITAAEHAGSASQSMAKPAGKVSGAKSKKQTATTTTQLESSGADGVEVVPKKRGRRRKLPIDPKFGNNDYIIMWPIICEDQRYLTDRYENIYTNDKTRPVFVGVREVSGKINKLAMPKVI